MINVNFKKVKESVLDTIHLKLEYMSGDADAFQYEKHQLEVITFSNYKEHLNIIENVVNQYKLISKFTDCNDELCLGRKRYGLKIGEEDAYNYIKENYSKELADMYESGPSDSTSDGQFKAYLSSIKLCGYNDKGEYFESYV